jgi:hypothetical protein
LGVLRLMHSEVLITKKKPGTEPPGAVDRVQAHQTKHLGSPKRPELAGLVSSSACLKTVPITDARSPSAGEMENRIDDSSSTDACRVREQESPCRGWKLSCVSVSGYGRGDI